MIKDKTKKILTIFLKIFFLKSDRKSLEFRTLVFLLKKKRTLAFGKVVPC